MVHLLAQTSHWGLALVPVLLLLALFVWLDVFKLMRLRDILILIVAGGVAALVAYPISGRFLDTLPIGFSNYSRFVAPWIEEALKGSVIVALFRWNRIGYKLDAVISGFAVGAGFSIVENVIYLNLFPFYGAGTWLVRGLGTAVMHGTTLAILAAVAHQLAERENRGSAGDFDFHFWWFLPGYFLAVAIHTIFNQFPERPLVAMLGAIMLAPVAVILLFRFGEAEADRWLAAESAAHHQQVEALRSGHWPDSPASPRIEALGERLGPEATRRIRRYWELQAWLVMQAEEVMIEEAAGDVTIPVSEIRAALAEMAGLRRALGRSTLTAVNALLPFSRNDQWEVSELRHRLGRA